MKQYKDILENILAFGYTCAPAKRQDIGTKQINSYEFVHDLREGFPLLTTKQLSFKNIVVELLWFLRGDTNIKYLVDNGCNIWNKDAYKYYLRKCEENGVSVPSEYDIFIYSIKNGEPSRLWHSDTYKVGDLGPVYGKQWRHSEWQGNVGESFKIVHVDQIAALIEDTKAAIAEGDNNRRLMVNAWNPGQLKQMALPPCHYGFQLILEPLGISELEKLRWEYINSLDPSVAYMEKGLDYPDLPIPRYYLNLKWNQRSVDTFLGLPYNIASYALLTHILARITNTIPKELIGSLTAVHIYDNHVEQCKEQLSRDERELPMLDFSSNVEIMFRTYTSINGLINDLYYSDFYCVDYDPHPAIKGEIVT